uniref:Uncharacterized protein KIAA0895-like n=1 Tax=Crassostrea virginica TaxID=6565 RepID=A0A8B8EX21_CRAVI|nr:uncharacterized protein KIAA0895-like [Crassostrea virginica]XP_022344545.1 uncharacterized protein KIAA0895-like [Crassostrea virginica]
MPTKLVKEIASSNSYSSFFAPVNSQYDKGRKKKKKKNAKNKAQQVTVTIKLLDRPKSDIGLKLDKSFCRTNTCDSLNSTKLPSIYSRSPPSPRLLTPLNRTPPNLSLNSVPTACERRKKLPLLAAIKPDNEKAEKERFMRANFQYNPYFVYKFPAEPEVLEKCSQPSDRFINEAIFIMENALEKYGTYEEFEAQTGGQVLSRPQILNIIKRYLKREELEDDIILNLTDELLSRGSMTRNKGKPQLNVRTVNLREMWVEGLLRHELGTHHLRSVNNRYQPWSNCKVRKDMGLRSMNPTEEGLASLHSVLFRKDPCLWRAAVLYYTVYKASQMSLKSLFKDLGQYVQDPNVRWDYCIRAKRGQTDTSRPGAFCKDQVYLDGALQLLKHRRHIDFQMLIRLGKIAWQDIDAIQSYADLQDTQIPFFMEDMTAYRKHLDRIAEANGLTDEILTAV